MVHTIQCTSLGFRADAPTYEAPSEPPLNTLMIYIYTEISIYVKMKNSPWAPAWRHMHTQAFLTLEILFQYLYEASI